MKNKGLQKKLYFMDSNKIGTFTLNNTLRVCTSIVNSTSLLSFFIVNDKHKSLSFFSLQKGGGIYISILFLCLLPLQLNDWRVV